MRCLDAMNQLNKIIMMDRENKDQAYLLGRLTAIVSKIEDKPLLFAADVNVNPLQKMSFSLVEALKKTDSPLYGELQEVVAALGVDYQLPSSLIAADAGRMWVGYYHQKSEMSVYEERVRIGKRIAELRKEKGLSVRALAELAGVSSQNITKIENGKYNVSIDILSKITNALNCKLDIVK